MRNRRCPSLLLCGIIISSLFTNQLCGAFLSQHFHSKPSHQSVIHGNINHHKKKKKKNSIRVKSFFRKKRSTYMMMNMEKTKKKLVLVGGGHAHLQVIKALRNNNNNNDDDACWEVTVVDVQTHASYSGMIPGCVAQWYKEEETQIDLQPLVQEWANATFLGGHAVTDIDLDQKHIITTTTTIGKYDEGETKKTIVPFDIVSLDIGSTVRGIMDQKYNNNQLPDCVIPTRPISHLIQRLEQLEQTNVLSSSSLTQKSTKKNVFIVGGGAAGIELSMALRQRWKKYDIEITILDSNTQLLPNENDLCRQALAQQLERLKIHIRHNATVTNITANTITISTTTNLEDEEQPCSVCIWATGAAPHSLAFQLQKRGLAVSDKGWIQVNPCLQSISHPDCVYAAGDCITIDDPTQKIKSPPKAGVYAVRSGPILIQNLLLLQQQQQQQKEQFVPQDDFLKILMCGDGTALAFRFGIPLYGPWVWELKHHIDTLFMNLFHPSTLQKESITTTKRKEEPSQYDDDVPSTTKTPNQAAQYLLRTDENVDYMEAWSILRTMISNSTYKTQVLQSYHSLLSPSQETMNIS